MRISIPGLGGRLRRARNATGKSQEKVAEEIGVSWMTVHRWERSQRAVPDHLLDKICELYDKPLRWFLTLEEGDLEDDESPGSLSSVTNNASCNQLARRIADAPQAHRTIVMTVAEDLLSGLAKIPA